MLKPGGILINMELPPNDALAAYDAFYLDWDCFFYNNEPFYKDFRDLSYPALCSDAGFPKDKFFQATMPRYTYVSESEFAQASCADAFDADTAGCPIPSPGTPLVRKRAARRHERQKAVKAGRPAFFSDPEIDRLLAITVRLMTEHSVLTERVKTLESLLIESGIISRDGLEGFDPSPDQDAESGRKSASD